ncbi:MAG: hypothetical protein JW839_17220 [Candidatus Lokiarchaeota archaeon]|nr:hypothetical protein [Candidatus Lokiarchaeota archaeon]
MSLIEDLDNLVQRLKEFKVGEPFTIEILTNTQDPYKPPGGIGWRKAMSLESAVKNATREVVIKIGIGTGDGFFYK